MMEWGGGVWDMGCNELVVLIGSPLFLRHTHIDVGSPSPSYHISFFGLICVCFNLYIDLF